MSNSVSSGNRHHLGRRVAQVWWGGLQGSGFGDIQKSGHLPAHHCEEAGVEVEETQREVSVTYPSRHRRRG